MSGKVVTSAADIISALGMQPHPEGGHYVETFRDRGINGRAAQTAIYYLLQEGEKSHWHRVTDASEIWLFHAGAPLKLGIAEPGEPAVEFLLGPHIAAGERPQCVVPAGCWQSAESTGAFTLVSCTVAPGFEFTSFEMAPPDCSPPIT